MLGPHEATPWTLLDIVLDNWKDDARGEEPTAAEWDAFLRWLMHDDQDLQLPSDRGLQLYFHWLDRTIGSVGESRGKLLRASAEEAKSIRKLQEMGRSHDATITMDSGKEVSIVDLWIDEACAKHALQVLGFGMTDRWRDIQAVIVNQDVRQRTFDYLDEAASCYLFGQLRASVMLARSSVELVLKESLGFPQGSDHGLRELIDKAKDRGVLHGGDLELAERIRTTANHVVHPRVEVTQELAKDILGITGQVVEALLGHGYEEETS